MTIKCPVCGSEKIKPISNHKGDPTYSYIQTLTPEIASQGLLRIGGPGFVVCCKACVECRYVMFFYDYDLTNKGE
jgi:hypothetical protein